MAEPMPLNVVNLQLDGSGGGTMTVRVASLREYNEALAHLDSDATLQDPAGRMRRFRFDGLPAQPSDFPCDVALAIVEEALPDDAVTQRMVLASNKLQGGCSVQVISFTPPTKDGGKGLLRVHCATRDEYEEIRRFIDEEHGSALKSMEGGVWYVHRIDDDSREAEAFPQKVTIQLEWLYRD
jgi:hypothetical protein